MYDSEKSEVFFVSLDQISRIKGILPDFKQPLGVKVHFGEEGNISYVRPGMIKPIIDLVENPTLIECSVLYKSKRRTAEGHREVAINHGFDFAPIDFLDGEEGDDFITAKIDNKHFTECFLGSGLEKYQSLLVISHFKGHGGSGFGGALKNLGMGLASRKGKLAQHASIKHTVRDSKCIACGTCISKCPVEAISYAEEGKARINTETCISCSKCISVCPVQAIRIPWSSTGTQTLQERIAEYALACTLLRDCFYINFLANIVEDCDCCDKQMQPLTPDIGILASNDPVALDQASYDSVVEKYPDFKSYNAEFMLSHGASIGLGSREYAITNLSE